MLPIPLLTVDLISAGLLISKNSSHPMAQSELLCALVADGELEDIKKLNLEGFDWNTCDPDGRTLMVVAIRSGMTGRCQEALKKIEWLISQGANITQKCTGGTWSIWKRGDEEASKLTLDCKNFSAVSLVQRWRESFKRVNPSQPWENAYNYLGQVWKVFANSSTSQNSRPKVSIDEGIAELWEKYLLATSTHDLTIETADGEVTAHAQMLKEASPVVRAMLASPMKEGQAQRIEVKDTSSGAVSLFLEILGDVKCFLIFPRKFLMQTII